jgi:hypothetical protein
MTAEIIARTLGGRRAGGGWIACCPAHEDRKPSLSITGAKGGKVLVRCHAGCEQARVVAALRSRGLWIGNSPRRFTRFAPRIVVAVRRGRDEANVPKPRSPFGNPPSRHRERQSRPISHRAASTCRHPTRFASMPA